MRIIFSGLFVFACFVLAFSYVLFPKQVYFSGIPKKVFLSDNGLQFSFRGVEEKTVGEFLQAQGLMLTEKESSFPPLEAPLSPNMSIFVKRTHEVTVKIDGEEKKEWVEEGSVDDAISALHLDLDEDDIVSPLRDTVTFRRQTIVVTRVSVTEEVAEKAVAFEKRANEDDKLSWRKTVVTQKGEKGADRLVYKVSSHDGKEVKRTLLRTERIKEPVAEVVTQGTEVKFGKSHTGAASWYAWTGTMAAANPWLPKGSFVKVTNTENNKSVIVVINDRGPFVPGRIIDLDKVAFQKIASVGAGVINVKMEEITN